MKVDIMSRQAAEKLIAEGFPRRTAVISLYSTRYWRRLNPPGEYISDSSYFIAIIEILSCHIPYSTLQ